MLHRIQWTDTPQTTALQNLNAKKGIAAILRLSNINNANIGNKIEMNDMLTGLFWKVWCTSICFLYNCRFLDLCF